MNILIQQREILATLYFAPSFDKNWLGGVEIPKIILDPVTPQP